MIDDVFNEAISNILHRVTNLENYTSKQKLIVIAYPWWKVLIKMKVILTLCPLPLIGCLYSLRISISTLKRTEEMVKQ